MKDMAEKISKVTEKYMISADGQDYFLNKEPHELYDEGLNIGETYYVAKAVKQKPSKYFYGAESIIELICEAMYEVADDWVHGYQEQFTEEKIQALEILIENWLDTNTKCPFFLPTDVEKFTLSEFDLTARQRKEYVEEQLKKSIVEGLS